MKSCELKELIKGGALEKFSELYSDTEAAKVRFLTAIEKFEELYGDGREVFIFSVPGRSEIMGNHTDHNRGCVIAGAVDRDIIAVAAKNEDGKIRFTSEGYGEIGINLADTENPDNFENYTSSALIAGVVGGLGEKGYTVGGFDAYSTTEVLRGSGISSSAAFEVMIGNILSHLYNGGKVSAEELAKLAQYSENVYFGKPCGLMDQMACAVGGFVFIDFEDKENPKVEPLGFSLNGAGYSLCIINTGGNHADLNEDYASIPYEMKSIAKEFGKDVLRGLTVEELIEKAGQLRVAHGDRAILRAMHFISENERVIASAKALKDGNLCDFFRGIQSSGQSSFNYLQNVYTTKNVSEQGLSLALCLAEQYISKKGGAFRVHGGGFAGTIQVFVKNENAGEFCAYMDKTFGEGASMNLRIRPVGACRLF